MTDDDFQATFGDGSEGMAEELAEERKQISIAEFFEKNKQMLGFDSKARALVTAIKEAVDNSLDATEEIGVLPEIAVEIEKTDGYYQVTVEDNGPGITKGQIPKVFGKLLYGSRFHARVQSRGQQGIGISAAVLYSQLTSGKPAKITSKTRNKEKAQYFELIIDTDENEAEIKKEKEVEWEGKSQGTKITLEMEANMRSRQQLHDYIRYTAVVNPHATVKYYEPDFELEFERVTEELPEETEEIPPHPHGVELGAVQDMLAKTDSYTLSGFLQEDFTRVGQKTAQNILNTYRDHEYGREMSWTVSDRDQLKESITNTVQRKGAEATDEFAEEICEAVSEAPYTFSEVKALVAEVAEDVADSFGKTFGSTVREKTTETVWENLKQEPYPRVYGLVQDATSSRKGEEVVSIMAEHIATYLEEKGGKQRVTEDELEELIDEAAEQATDETGTSVGDKARESIFSAFWNQMETVDEDVPTVKEIQGQRDKVANLMYAMHSTKVMAPPTRCLSPIYPDKIEKGMKTVFDAEFYSASTRDAGVHSGEPFIVEAGIAYGGSLEAEGKIEITRFANRVPLVYQRGACSITDVVKQIGWRNYKLSQSGGYGIPDGPVVLLVHIASTNVPFTSEAKDAVANVPEIEEEIEHAVREVARDLKSYLKEQQSLRERREKEDVLARILPVMAEKAASVVGEEPADIKPSQAKIMNSILVTQNREELELTNHSNSSESFSLKLDFASKPKYVSDVLTRRETDDGRWELVWEGSLQSGESIEASWNLDRGVHGPEFEIDLPTEKYSMVEQ